MSWPHKKTPRRGDSVNRVCLTDIQYPANGTIVMVLWPDEEVIIWYKKNQWYPKGLRQSVDFDTLNGAWNTKLNTWIIEE